MIEGIALRRAQFLIDEARHGMKKRDLAITMVLRCLSNYLTVGADGDSFKVKKLNNHMSARARQLKSTVPEREWHRQTTNEHQLELKTVWEYVVTNADTLTAEQLCNYMRAYPFVTVHIDENTALRAIKDHTSPEERYTRAGISLLPND